MYVTIPDPTYFGDKKARKEMIQINCIQDPICNTKMFQTIYHIQSATYMKGI